MTYGDFRAWLVLAWQEARRQGRDEISFRQGNVAFEFRVHRKTVRNWCRKAYAEGLLKARIQRIQLADGTWRRIANSYVVALAVKLRLILRQQWALLRGGTVSPPAVTIDVPRIEPEPQKTAVSPYGQSVAPENSARVRYLPISPERAIGRSEDQEPRSFWNCRGCSTANAWPSPWCRSCKAEKPFQAERCF